MFRTRLLTALVAVPLAIFVIGRGGLWLFGFVTFILSVAVLEFCRLTVLTDFRPTRGFALVALWVVLADAQFPQWDLLGPGLSVVLMASLAWQLGHREGHPFADWALTIAGPLYVGWCGAHVIRLRSLPDGQWWLMTALPAIWLADSGAYLIGKALGRHALAPTLSPKKTWEGYLGGIVVGSLATAALAVAWGRWSGPAGPSSLDGLMTGAVVSTVAPLGDLAVSMIKREAGVKDTGVLFPGHGGALDRVDSTLWAAVIGYYIARWAIGLG